MWCPSIFPAMLTKQMHRLGGRFVPQFRNIAVQDEGHGWRERVEDEPEAGDAYPQIKGGSHLLQPKNRHQEDCRQQNNVLCPRSKTNCAVDGGRVGFQSFHDIEKIISFNFNCGCQPVFKSKHHQWPQSPRKCV